MEELEISAKDVTVRLKCDDIDLLLSALNERSRRLKTGSSQLERDSRRTSFARCRRSATG